MGCLSDQADASILVVRQDTISDKTINDAIDSLSRCKARFLGFVFNDVHTLNIAAGLLGGRRYGYGYGYGRSYGYGYGSSKDKKGYGYGYGYGYGNSKERQSLSGSAEQVDLRTSRKED